MKFSVNFIKAGDELCDLNNRVPAPYIRKAFCLDFVPEKAEITICGLGFYELYINGENITKGPLAPYISNTNHICYYDNYDISEKLKKGENVIGILLGNGMRNAFGGFVWDFEKASFRGVPVVALCLEAKGEGKSFELEADESFKTHPSPITSNDLRMGYCYNALLEVPGWNEVNFDDISWAPVQKAQRPVGEAKLCEAEPITEYERLEAVSITHYDELPFAYESTLDNAKPIESTIRKNVYVYDFGVNNAGVTALKINGKPGQKITIRHAEALNNGKFSINTTIFNRPETLAQCLEFSQKDEFICKGGEEYFVPKFKYDGFRYAYVEGLEPHQATKDALTYIVMSSKLKVRADFKCSDETLNKLFEMTRRSDLSNFYYFPTDCPQREKNGWTGDISMSAEHLLLNLDCKESLKEWYTNLIKSQTVEGRLPTVVPNDDWQVGTGGPTWDAVCTSVPYYIYKFDGDTDVIRNGAPMILRYLSYGLTRRDEQGLIEYGLGDWVDPFYDIPRSASPLKFTSTVSFLDIANKAAYLFAEAGLLHESDFALGIANEMRECARRNLIDFETMTVIGDCQTSQAVAIELGLFDENEIDIARKRLVEIIHRDGDINKCGMLGLRHIYHALTNAGESELAYKLITSTERSCYGAWVKRGATTLLENFPYDDGSGLCSQNHHFLGDISSWMIQEIAGVKPNPEVKDIGSFEISPHFIPDIEFAEGYYDSSLGRLECAWKRNGEKIKMSISVPSGMSGRLVLDNGFKPSEKIPESFVGGEYTISLEYLK